MLLVPPFCRPDYQNIFDDIDVLRFGSITQNQPVQLLINYRIEGKVLNLSPNATFSLILHRNQIVKDRELVAHTARELVSHATELRLEEIRFRLPPDGFEPDFVQSVTEAFKQYKHKEVVDTNNYVEVLKWNERQMSKGNRKRLRQSRELGMSTMRISDGVGVDSCFELLERNRAARGLGLSMSSEVYKRSIANYPDDYQLYGAVHGRELVSCALLIRLSRQRLYVFMWGHDPKWSHRSPVVFLFERLIRLSEEQGFQVLDLGTSSVGGVTDEGLMRFKLGLGSSVEPKRTLVMQIGGDNER